MIQPSGRIRLLIACAVGAIVWLIVLPWIARLQVVQDRIRRNQAAGIDPSAMFYTDLEHLRYEGGMLRRQPKSSSHSAGTE